MPDALGMGCSVDLVISLVCVVVSSKFILTSLFGSRISTATPSSRCGSGLRFPLKCLAYETYLILSPTQAQNRGVIHSLDASLA